MFYLLFGYLKDEQEKVYEEFKSKEALINFIKERRDEIEIEKIIEAGREFKLNWILKLDEIDGPEPKKRGRKKKEKEEEEEEPEPEPEPEPELKHLDKEEEPEKEEIEAPPNPEEIRNDIKRKDEDLMKRANNAIEAAKKVQGGKIIKWELCVKCGKNKVVSSKARKICSDCLKKEKKQALGKRKEEILLSYESSTKSKEEER